MKYEYTAKARTVMADLHTPVGAYLRLRDLHPMSALMESSDYHDRANSRSFICTEPMASIAVGHGKCTMSYPDGSRMLCANSSTALPSAATARSCAEYMAIRRSTPCATLRT